MAYSFEDYQSMLLAIRAKTSFIPQIGLILGSGLDDFLREVQIAADLPFQEIPGHPLTTNAAHKGHYLFGTYEGIRLVIMAGRLHYYEGYSAEEVALPIRLMKLMGVGKLIITNACGGISFGPGNLMLISDHISTNVPSPLLGKNIDAFGPRFPDMSDPWDEKDRSVILREAKQAGLPVQEGVYMQFSGPQYETKAEIQMAERSGADAVGMSTVIEAIAATQMGIPNIGIASIANWACGKAPGKLNDADVLKASQRIAPQFASLLKIALHVMAQPN